MTEQAPSDTDPRLRPEPVFAALDRSVANKPTAPAIWFQDRRWTYGELGRLVDRAARGLQDIGVMKGARVGLCMPNCPYSVIMYFAALKAGAIVVNFNPLYVEKELRAQIRDSGTTVMVTLDAPSLHDKIVAVAEDSGLRRVVLCRVSEALPPLKGLAYRLLKRKEQSRLPRDGRHIEFSRLIASDKPPAPVIIDPVADTAVLQYTGGTTGVPKAAQLTHANVSVNAAQVEIRMGDVPPNDQKVLGVLPLFHVFAMTGVMNIAARVGAEMILEPRFDVARTLMLIETLQPTIFPAVPTIYNALAAASEESSPDLTSVQYCISGGAPLPQDVRLRFEGVTGARVVEGYGLSETSPVLTCNPLDGTLKDGSVGTPVLGTVIEIRDADDPSRILGVGERGEVCARGPQVMKGYWNRPEETAAVFVDGALRTGDAGYLDEDGYLFLVDRLKDLILCGGFNVYPRVIEEALYTHPAVAEATVIGVPDDYRGEAPKAFVSLKPGMTATPEDLRAHLTDQISKIEMPREIELRDVLPRTAVGKLSKKELVAEEKAKAEARKAEAEAEA